MFLKDRLRLLKTKEEKRNKALKRIYRADEKFLDKKTDALLYIPKRELTKCLFLIFWQILQFTEQIYICGIFKENSQEIFPVYLVKIHNKILGNIPKSCFGNIEYCNFS